MKGITDSGLDKLWPHSLRYQGPHANADIDIFMSFGALEHPTGVHGVPINSQSVSMLVVTG